MQFEIAVCLFVILALMAVGLAVAWQGWIEQRAAATGRCMTCGQRAHPIITGECRECRH